MLHDAERDTLLLNSLTDVVPNSTALAKLREIIAKVAPDGPLLDMIDGYGTLINIIQAATEMEDVGDLYDRLSAGYYELTNKEPLN